MAQMETGVISCVCQRFRLKRVIVQGFCVELAQLDSEP